jgi:hypothetical protein
MPQFSGIRGTPLLFYVAPRQAAGALTGFSAADVNRKLLLPVLLAANCKLQTSSQTRALQAFSLIRVTGRMPFHHKPVFSALSYPVAASQEYKVKHCNCTSEDGNHGRPQHWTALNRGTCK